MMKLRTMAAIAGTGMLATLAYAGSDTCAELDSMFTKVVNRTSTYDTGYVVEYYDNEEDKECAQSFLLFPAVNLWPQWLKVVVYFLMTGYLFLGVAIISDVFMASVEVITAKETTVTMKDGTSVTVKYWNPTVANLTLMALGSSAPEILLAVIETITTLGKTPGELGPSTIVGSASFNLLAITAVCIMAIPEGEIRKVSDVGVFMTTATWSLWAYIWMLIVLEVWTPGVVSLEEAFITFGFFPTFVFHAFCQDKNWFQGGGEEGDEEDGAEIKDVNDIKLLSLEVNEDGTQSSIMDDKNRKKEMIKMVKVMRVGKLAKEKMGRLASNIIRGSKDRKEASGMFWKINARRAMGGRRHYKKAGSDQKSPYETDSVPDDAQNVESLAQLERKDCKILFSAREYRVLENAGTVTVAVKRVGGITRVAQVDYHTIEGTAVPGKDFHPAAGTVVFQPGETQKMIEVGIIDDDEPEPDQTFCVQLTNPSGSSGTGGEVHLGATSIAQVVIIDDDDPGVLGFEKAMYEVDECAGEVALTVCRYGGAAGRVTVDFFTTDGSAVAGEDYVATEGTVTFESGEVTKDIAIAILDDEVPEPDTVFHVFLRNPTGMAQLHKQNVALVKVVDDDGIKDLAHEVEKKMKVKELFMVKTHSWRQQIMDAMDVGSGVDEDGNEEEVGGFDYLLHVLTFGWKVIFALLPPTEMGGGWYTFCTSLMMIGVITAVVGESASLFGCSVGLKDSVTAITFVALGTSLPDTFASKQAAQEADDADAAIGNVTGSNSVNVFLGLGLPWVIGAIYYTIKDDVSGGKYCVPSSSLAYSVMVFSGAALCCLLLLFVRRKLVGGELGGESQLGRWASSIFLFGLWLFYIVMSALKTHGHVQGIGKDKVFDFYGCDCAASHSTGKGC